MASISAPCDSEAARSTVRALGRASRVDSLSEIQSAHRPRAASPGWQHRYADRPASPSPSRRAPWAGARCAMREARCVMRDLAV